MSECFLGMESQQFAIVHLVHMIARQDQHIVRLGFLQDIQVLEHRIGRARIPRFFNPLLGGQHIDELAEPAVQETPAALNMPEQAVGFILCCHADAAYAGVHAVRQDEIDNAKFSAKRDCRFRAPIGQLMQAAAAATRQDHGVSVLGHHADKTGFFRWRHIVLPSRLHRLPFLVLHQPQHPAKQSNSTPQKYLGTARISSWSPPALGVLPSSACSSAVSGLIFFASRERLNTPLRH